MKSVKFDYLILKKLKLTIVCMMNKKMELSLSPGSESVPVQSPAAT